MTLQVRKWFFDGHPLRYHVAALALALLAVSTAVTTHILADDTATTTAADGTSTTACSFNYSSWGACQSNGARTRSVTNTSPSGCVQTDAPETLESCTYSAPVTATTIHACSYSYSSWGGCQSNDTRTRSVTSASPSGCSATTAPALKESCTFSDSSTPTTTGTSSTSGTGTSSQTTATSSAAVTSTSQCSFVYSDWGACQKNGKRTRTWSSKFPTGCTEYTHPVLEQTCVYDDTPSTGTTESTSVTGSTPTTTSASSTTTQGDGTGSGATAVTPGFSFMNVGEGTVVAAQKVEYYLVPVGSNTYKYIGSAQAKSATEWRLNFHSSDFPNGDSYLRARIKNLYGEYGSGQRKISIRNESQGTAETTAQDGFVSLEMSAATKVEMLKQTAQELQIPVNSSIAADNPDQQKKYIFDYCQSNVDKCSPERDSDHDGLSDIDEVRYGTNPKLADTDMDGFLDGDEVKNGFDPLKYSTGDQNDRIVFESPKESGETKPETYAVKQVTLTQAGAATTKKLQLTGKGLPNSFVTIYIFSSDPIVLTVKTDSDGNWTYELDKELADGQHEAYVAVTDNTGKITARSEPLPFVKTAQAVTVIPAAQAAPAAATQPVSENRAQRDILLLVAIIIAAVAVALATIGLIRHRHTKALEEKLTL